MRLGIGIDPGYESLGMFCADLTTRRVLDHATVHTPRSKSVGDRMRLVHRQLSLMLARPGVEVVGYESPFRVGKAKQAKRQSNYNPLLLMRVVGYTESLAWERGILVYGWEPPDVKKAVLGPGGGTADKGQVRRAVRLLYGIELNEHEADAAATWTVTMRRWRIDMRLAEMNA